MSPRSPRRALAVVSAVLAGLVGVAAAPAALAAPTCTIPGTEGLCGGRIVAEPSATVSFVQFGIELQAVLEAIEALNPDVVEVATIAEWNNDPSHTSFGGNPIWVVRVTDESVPDEGKAHVAASLSVHGNESAGREGGLRYLEDVARWSVDDPDRLVYSGDAAFPVSEVLEDTVLWLAFLNPDAWASGDLLDPAGVGFPRGNANNGGLPHTSATDGADLNREFPTIGWTKRANTQLSEPEAIAWVDFVTALPNLVTATDIHGELTSATGSFADMMWPAGQWTPTRQAQELQLAESMTATIERKFEEHGVVIDDIFALFGEDSGLGTKPAQYATAYDIVGYDDSGFMGDWFAAQGAVEIDVENFLSHLVPNNAWFGLLEEGHAAAVRGIVESIWVEALVTADVEADLDLGRVAYLDDPAVVSSTDSDGFGFELEDGEDPVHYDVTRMRYFADLAADAGVPIDALDVADIADTDLLGAYDTIVVADNASPTSRRGGVSDRSEVATALVAFAEGGGQVLLTDDAVQMLVDMELVAADAIQSGTAEAGHVDFGAIDHPWEADLAGLPAQTYYEVPLGYRSGDGEPEAPHHGVDTAAWEDAGGVTVGTSLGFTSLGEMPVGDGTIAIFGAILPTQTEANPHLYGLADYGLTVNGGAVLHTILEHRSGLGPVDGDDAAADAPADVDDAATPPADPAPLPVTGGGAALAGLAALAVARRLRRQPTW